MKAVTHTRARGTPSRLMGSPPRSERNRRGAGTARRLPILFAILGLCAMGAPSALSVATAQQTNAVPADVLWQVFSLSVGVGTLSDDVVAARLEQRFGLMAEDARRFVARSRAYLDRLRTIDESLRRSVIGALAPEGSAGDSEQRFVTLPSGAATMRDALAGTGLVESGRALRSAEADEYLRVLRIDLSAEAMTSLERWVTETVASGIRRFDSPDARSLSKELEEKLKRGRR